MKSLQITFRYAAAFLMVFSLMILSGCEKEPEGPTKTIYQLISEDPSLAAIKAEIDANADLKATLEGDGSFTFFAPSNTAITNLLSIIGLTDFSSIDPVVVNAVLFYHLLNSKTSYEDLSGTMTTVETESFMVLESGGVKTLKTGSTTTNTGFISQDEEATNGYLHIVDYPMIPPSVGAAIELYLGTAGQPIMLGANFTTLKGGVLAADAYATENTLPTITSILINQAEDITVFAPSNGTFTQAGIGVSDLSGAAWYGTILHHIVSGIYDADEDFTVDSPIETKSGGSIVVLTKDAATSPPLINSGVEIDSNADATKDAQIAVYNVFPANNGVVNVIAGILSPQ